MNLIKLWKSLYPTVYTDTVCKGGGGGGEWGSWERRGPQTYKTPATFFTVTTSDIAFYQSNLSTGCSFDSKFFFHLEDLSNEVLFVLHKGLRHFHILEQIFFISELKILWSIEVVLTAKGVSEITSVGDPWHFGADPDPGIRTYDFKDAKKFIFSHIFPYFFLITCSQAQYLQS